MRLRPRLRIRLMQLQLAGLRTLFKLIGPFFSSYMSKLALHLWFTPPRHKVPLREIMYEETARHEYLQHNGNAIATYSWGEGPPVLLAHGWGGRGTQMHAFVNPLVENGFKVVSLDAPGHGRSPGTQTDVFEYVFALQAVNDRHGPFEGVIAHSFGNPAIMLALFQGVLHTKRVVGISPPFTFEGMLDKFCHRLGIPTIVRKRVHQHIAQLFGEDAWDWLRADAIAPKLVKPALIIHDQQDQEIPLYEGEATAAQWPGAQFVPTLGLGHHRIIRHPEVAELAMNFIATGKVSDRPSIKAAPAVIQVDSGPARQPLWKSMTQWCPFRN